MDEGTDGGCVKGGSRRLPAERADPNVTAKSRQTPKRLAIRFSKSITTSRQIIIYLPPGRAQELQEIMQSDTSDDTRPFL